MRESQRAEYSRDPKATSTYSFPMACIPIRWRSPKRHVGATSTYAVEYISFRAAERVAELLKLILRGLIPGSKHSLVLYRDSHIAI